MRDSKILKLDQKSTYDAWQKRRAADSGILNTYCRKGQIVLCGDSIVEGWPVEDIFDDLRSRTFLSVYNRGISGDTAKGLCDRIETNVCILQPKAIYILIGTNDLGKKFPIEYTIDNYTRMLSKIKVHSPDSKIFIQSVLPVNKGLDSSMVGARKNKKVMELNGKLKTLAQETNSVYVDVYDKFLDAMDEMQKELSYDGLHLNMPGYKLLTDLITPIIAEELK